MTTKSTRRSSLHSGCSRSWSMSSLALLSASSEQLRTGFASEIFEMNDAILRITHSCI